MKKIRERVTLRPVTVELLEILFAQRSLSQRDAMSHGAFFAGDQGRVECALGGLTTVLAGLLQDFEAAGVLPTIWHAPRWDAERCLPDWVTETLKEQFSPACNLRQAALEVSQTRGWLTMVNKLWSLVPDKVWMGQAAFLLWVSGQEDAHYGREDPTQHFAAIFAGLVTLEELFRAVFEVHGLRVLHVQGDGPDRVRCELSILDDRLGQLLDPALLSQVFRVLHVQEPFRQGLEAVRVLRDSVMHGAWGALRDSPLLYSHLIAKVLFELCEAVVVEE